MESLAAGEVSTNWGLRKGLGFRVEGSEDLGGRSGLKMLLSG